MHSELNIGFLGLGKMGSAIAGGLLVKNTDSSLFGYDIKPPNTDAFPSTKKIRLIQSAEALEDICDLLILCVKPQIMQEALEPLKGNKLYISIAAGLETESLRRMFPDPDSVKIARVMPNISALIGRSVSGIYCKDPHLLALTKSIFDAVGHTAELSDEELMHAVTGLSGSGPAFVFAFIQSLAEGGVLCGLPYEMALQLAAHTLRGAADLLIESGDHPEALRNRVTSPGGTTIAGLQVLEEEAFHGTVMNAVEAATERSIELGLDSYPLDPSDGDLMS